jgi:predicted NUDIX family NTP pyrophosphohydrolase
MPKKSAGVLLYRSVSHSPEVFLVHPGGPFWAKKDEGAWSIPKGEFAEGEDPMAVAKREFREETGFAVSGEFERLQPVRQPSGKIVYAWSVEGDVDAAAIHSNSFTVEWPRGSGKLQEFPEVDRGGWFDLKLAKRKIIKGQVPLLEQLQKNLARKGVACPRGQNTSGRMSKRSSHRN